MNIHLKKACGNFPVLSSNDITKCNVNHILVYHSSFAILAYHIKSLQRLVLGKIFSLECLVNANKKEYEQSKWMFA